MMVDSDVLSTPGEYDILCGRGRGYFEHPGNRRMLRIVQEHKEQYQKASKTMKTKITAFVFQQIQDSGDISARFLKEVENSCNSKSKGKKKSNKEWCILSDKEAQKKVAHTLREQKKIIKSIDVVMRKRKTSSPIAGVSPTPLARISFLNKNEELANGTQGSSPSLSKNETFSSSGCSSDGNDALIKKSQEGHEGYFPLEFAPTPIGVFSTNARAIPTPQMLRKVSSVTVSDDETSLSSSSSVLKTIGFNEDHLGEHWYYSTKILPLNIGYEPVFTSSEIDIILNTVEQQEDWDIMKVEKSQDLGDKQHGEQLEDGGLVLDEFLLDLNM